MPLHTDYRPVTLETLVGNEALVTSLKSIFERESDYPHAILMQGPSGCGKTTVGRIIKDLLCCKGHDFIEVNASNNRGIDTARQIMDSMRFKPSVPGSKCRVYLIDECHATTKDFQNALLKALEDAPNHVYFILCTTDPNQLLITVRNRCTTFEVQALSDRQIVKLLQWVLAEEKVDDIPDTVIKAVADASEGCPRQSLVILDQIIDMPVDKMESAIQGIRAGDRNTLDLYKALANKESWKRIQGTLKLMDLGNPETVRRAIIGLAAAEVMRGDSPQAAMIYEEMKDPFYNTGKAGLIFACYKLCVMGQF